MKDFGKNGEISGEIFKLTIPRMKQNYYKTNLTEVVKEFLKEALTNAGRNF